MNDVLSKTAVDAIQMSWVVGSRLSALGWDIINCGRGNPSHQASVAALSAMTDALRSQYEEVTRNRSSIGYGSTGGIPLYRQECAELLSAEYRMVPPFNESEIFILHGGKAGLAAVFAAISDAQPGAFVALPEPGYHYHRRLAERFAKVVPFPLRADGGFRLGVESVRRGLARANVALRDLGALIVTDPSNPAGTKLTAAELECLAEFVKECSAANDQFHLVLDESFRNIVYVDDRRSLLEIAPDVADRTILLRSGTKEFGLAADRLCVFRIPRRLCDGFSRVVSDLGITAAPLHQAGMVRGLASQDAAERTALAEYYRVRAHAIADVLRPAGMLPGNDYEPQGTFFLPVRVGGLFGRPFGRDSAAALKACGVDVPARIGSDKDLMLALISGSGALGKCGVATVPLYSLQSREGWLRLSLSEEPDRLREAARRLVAAERAG